MKRVFLKILQNLRENTCARVSFLIRSHASDLQLYYKRDSDTDVFPWSLRNLQEHLFLKNNSGGYLCPCSCLMRKICTPYTYQARTFCVLHNRATGRENHLDQFINYSCYEVFVVALAIVSQSLCYHASHPGSIPRVMFAGVWQLLQLFVSIVLCFWVTTFNVYSSHHFEFAWAWLDNSRIELTLS